MKNTALSARIMRRVYVTYLGRQLTRPLALKVYALTLITASIASLVSISNVAANLPTTGGFFAFYDFSRYAIMHTEFIVQLLLFGAIIFALWLVRDCIANIGSLSFSRHA